MMMMMIMITISSVSFLYEVQRRQYIRVLLQLPLVIPCSFSSIITHQSMSPIVKTSYPDVFCGVYYVLSVLELQT